MSTHFNKQRIFHPHEAFAYFGGLLFAFSLGRLIWETVERFGTTTSAWVALAAAAQCAVVLSLMANASAKRASRTRVLMLSGILIASHFLVFAIGQLIRPLDEAALEDVSLLSIVIYHFASAAIAYWVACVIIFERMRELLFAVIAPGCFMIAGVWWVLQEPTLATRILWTIGSALGFFGVGWVLFTLSNLPAVRGVFANRPQHYLMTELLNAKRVHESLFPDPIAAEGYRFGYAYRPMQQIGGDFIHVFPEGKGGASNDEATPPFYLTMIDVTGHGISSALTVNRLNAELQQYFAGNPTPCPSEVLAHLNDYAVVTMAEHGLFATAVCIRVDTEAGQLTIANAGHPPCFFRSESELRLIEAEGAMLGVFPGEAFEADPVSFAYKPGERLILFTDGATEAYSVTGEMLGSERLYKLVEGACTRCVAPVRDAKTDELLKRDMPGRLLDRADVHKPVGLIQQVLRQRMNAHPCTLADEIMLSIDDFVQQDSQDDILIATIELLQTRRVYRPQGEQASQPTYEPSDEPEAVNV